MVMPVRRMTVLVFILRMVFRVVDNVDHLLGGILPARAGKSRGQSGWLIAWPAY